MSIEGKVQVVTGGTSGMGLANAIELGKYGPVLVGGRNEERLAGAVEQMKASGVDAYGKTCDISDRASVEEFVEYARSIGQIGGVVNAAGVDWGKVSNDALIDINMVGAVNVTEAFLPYIDDGVMVHYSSITGYFFQPSAQDKAVWDNPNDLNFRENWKQALVECPHPSPAPGLGDDFMYYAGSKRFIMYYTMANAKRFGAKNARIFSIAPGSFDTPMLRGGVGYSESTAKGTAFGRFGKPEEMACLIAQLMGPGHDYLTGCDIVHDGGKLAMSLVKQL